MKSLLLVPPRTAWSKGIGIISRAAVQGARWAAVCATVALTALPSQPAMAQPAQEDTPRSRRYAKAEPAGVSLIETASHPIPFARPGANVPPGFRLVTQATGVTLYERSSEFVQVVNLAQGASVKLRHGRIVSGGYGGGNPRIWKDPLQQVWEDFSSSNKAAFCLTNGQFFYSTRQNPTTLALPLKTDGVIVSNGYATHKWPNQKLMLEIWQDRAEISVYTQRAFQTSSAPDVIVGLSEYVNARSRDAAGRTFIGVADGNRDGRHETLLVFNSPAATTAHAGDVLRHFGAAKIAMLDGGGSTQLICQDTLYIPSSAKRPIPQTLAVISGPDTLSSIRP